jgi:hypothetical protein
MTSEADMGVAALPRWTWILVGLAVGLLHGSLREWASTSDPTDDYDVLLADQRQFEAALVGQRLGHRLFKDVTVYPHWVRSRATGEKRLVHLVTGAYWDGNTQLKGDAVVARWEPACFVAPVPYGSHATVLDYLAELKAREGVQYRYAWWWWTGRPTFTSTVVAVTVIGVIWPTAVNLLAFGRLTRPPRQRQPSLWRVRREKSAPAPPPTSSTPPSAEREPIATDVAVSPSPAAAAPVLMTEAVGPAPSQQVEHHYGARPDDFYPTELHPDERQ